MVLQCKHSTPLFWLLWSNSIISLFRFHLSVFLFNSQVSILQES